MDMKWYEHDDPPSLTEVIEGDDFGVPCALVTHGINDCDVTFLDLGDCSVHARSEVDEDSRKITLTFDPDAADDLARRLLSAAREDLVELEVNATVNLSWDCNPSPQITFFHEYVGLLSLIDFLKALSS